MPHARPIWAIIVGIDHYTSDARNNLGGCVRDAERVRGYLLHDLHVPEACVSMLVQPDPSAPPLPFTYQRPLLNNVLKTIEDVSTVAKAGDLVWFHFSGHGDRVLTRHWTIKKDTRLDEVLCTLDEDLRGVDFDACLSQLVRKSLRVAAVLDACHSGGATRSQALNIKCRSRHHDAIDSPIPGINRNMKSRESWFYTDRDYHVIAACQPYQIARELTDDQYRDIQQRLNIEVSQRRNQQPMVLGNNCATIGSDALSRRLPGYIIVSGVDDDYITFSQGLAAGVALGDHFELEPPNYALDSGFKDENSVTAVITSIDDLSSRSKRKALTDDHSKVEAGWTGRLKCRDRALELDISNLLQLNAQLDSASYEKVTTRVYVYLFTFNLMGEKPAETKAATYTVKAPHDDLVEVFDSQDQAIVPISRIDISSCNVLEKILDLLRHIHLYRSFETLAPSSSNSKPRYEFRVEDVDGDLSSSCADVFATKRVVFKNTDSHVLFISIFNLTSGWGIYRIFPREDEPSLAVEPHKEIPELILDIKASGIHKNVPEAGGSLGKMRDVLKVLITSKLGKMRDVLKVLITSKPVDFSHYKPEGMRVDGTSGNDAFRRTVPRTLPISKWWCDQVEMYT